METAVCLSQLNARPAAAQSSSGRAVEWEFRLTSKRLSPNRTAKGRANLKPWEKGQSGKNQVITIAVFLSAASSNANCSFAVRFAATLLARRGARLPLRLGLDAKLVEK